MLDGSICQLHSRILRVQQHPLLFSTELGHENNCFKVWKKVTKHLTTSNVTMARVMSHWKVLFGLKCESRNDFLAFYSKANGILHKLKKGNSVAVTDNVFLQAY